MFLGFGGLTSIVKKVAGTAIKSGALNAVFPGAGVALKIGDTLAKVAASKMNKPGDFRQIAEMNNLDIFSKLPIGKTLKLPSTQAIADLAMETLAKKTENVFGAKLTGDFGGIVASTKNNPCSCKPDGSDPSSRDWLF